MKNKIRFSVVSTIITIFVLVVFVVGIIALIGNTDKLIVFCCILGAMIIAGLFYCPKSVEANGSGITLYRLLSLPKFIEYAEIQSVDTCYPSSVGFRLCASGGFFGYWGYFKDPLIGTYFGYYGSRDSCFLIKLKNGMQYIIGCENAVAMVEYINSQMSHR